MTIRILLADDHAIMREGLRARLEQEKDMAVIADVGDGRQAVKFALQEKPDVVVMDISMPNLNGIDATRQIVFQLSQTRVICLSMHREKKFVGEMLRAGAMGYILKNGVARELVEAIRQVLKGGIYLSPDIAANVVDEYVRKPSVSSSNVFASLSEREREVLQLIAEGSSTKEIATKLNISEKTVGAHREHVMLKLNLHNIADLTRYALREGIAEL